MTLTPSIRYGDLELTAAPYLWEYGGDLGAPELVVEVLEQQLQDGEVVASDRSSNREIALTILVDASDLAAQADAEAALALEAAKPRNTLTFDPGDGIAPVTVFDTFVAELAFDRDDEHELNNLRRWQLTIPALPFARSDTLTSVSVAAPPPAVSTTQVDDGTSTTGWALPAQAGSANPTYSASTSWTAPDNVTSVTVEAVGAGGGGSGMSSDGTVGGGGGGGGAYASSVIAVTPGTSYAVTVGAGGARGASNGVGGTAGGASIFGSNLVKGAGGGGGGAPTAGAAGSVASSIGTTRTAGSAGQAGYYTGGGLNVNGGVGGNGAPPLGSSTIGKGGTGDGDFTSSTAGTAGRVRLAYSGSWSLSTESGSLKALKSSAALDTNTLTRTGLAVAIGTRPIVKIDTRWALSTGTVAWKLNGADATILSQSGGTYFLDASGITTLNSIEATLSTTAGQGAAFYIDNIALTNSMVPGSTGRENARQLAVAGSARAVASLSLSDASAALGNVLVYTTSDQNSIQPPLRTYLDAGPTVTADTTTVSGATTPLTTLHTFTLPASGVPSGGYLLLARVRYSTLPVPSEVALNLSWSAYAKMGSTALSGAQSGSTSYKLYSGSWTILTVAMMTLPPMEVGPDGKVVITLSADVSGMLLDEAWLFNMDSGRLTWVDCGTGAPSAGGPSSRLWIDPASIDDPKPSLWRGTSSTRVDAVHAGLYASAWGIHEFVPPQVNVFTVTTDSTAAALEIDYYPRWHTHVGTAS